MNRITPGRDFNDELLPNNKLDRAMPLLDEEITGPESIAVRGHELFTGIIGGSVIKLNLENNEVSTVARFGRNCGNMLHLSFCY